MATFAITAASDRVTLKPVVPQGKKEPESFTGQASYTITNTGPAPVQGTVVVATPKEPVKKEWITLAGSHSFTLAPQATTQSTVAITCPAGTPAGSYSGSIVVKNDANPDEDSTGQAVSFEVPASKAPPKFPWAILVLAAVVIVGVTVALLLRPQHKPAPAKTMPDLVNKPVNDAVSAVQALGLGITPTVTPEINATVGPGLVIRTDPGVSATLTAGQKVTLFTAIAPQKIALPDVRNLDSTSAKNNILNASGDCIGHCFVVTFTEETSFSTPQGSIVSSQPGPGTLLAEGSSVVLSQSCGPQLCLVRLPFNPFILQLPQSP